MNDLEEKICSLIDSKYDEIIDFLGKLVRIPSVVGHELEAKKFIYNTFLEMGLENRLLRT